MQVTDLVGEFGLEVAPVCFQSAHVKPVEQNAGKNCPKRNTCDYDIVHGALPSDYPQTAYYWA
jgi:hypothetical protein